MGNSGVLQQPAEERQHVPAVPFGREGARSTAPRPFPSFYPTHKQHNKRPPSHKYIPTWTAAASAVGKEIPQSDRRSEGAEGRGGEEWRKKPSCLLKSVLTGSACDKSREKESTVCFSLAVMCNQREKINTLCNVRINASN
ncbi:hypothetical protein SKAU_G00133350 [Synaphobranchus kaupii]|uniref:Uncharacterized protein n=1 Tax=Synaphobranchus kaupii TaxID=118154 RepID=A0A9Q1J2J8_SYNKA|nr:hypothetical protein SKAU_G00133350 [Synaphobranchus kaupii]